MTLFFTILTMLCSLPGISSLIGLLGRSNVKDTPFGVGPFSGDYTVNGYDILQYYWKYFWTIADEYSWQIRTCYTIIVLSIACLIALFILFFVRVRLRNRTEQKIKKIKERFEQRFRDILTNPEVLSYEDIENLCECSHEEFKRYDTACVQRVAIAVREELQEVIYLPNMETLCQVTGIRDRIEFNLIHHREEFDSLQSVTIFQLPIGEGVLANFVNHRDLDLRNLARISYMLSTEVEPYRYLLDFARDTANNDGWAPWYPMALHQIFGWIMSNERPMPNFITLVEQADAEEVAAFFLLEMSYWATFEEQQYISNYFTSESYKIRSAAFQAVAMLCDESQEEAMIKSYPLQPEPLRREIINAIYSIKSGNQISFFEDVCNTSPSKETRELAISCLYDYSTEARLVFERLRYENNEHNRGLFDQIESSQLLNQIRRL